MATSNNVWDDMPGLIDANQSSREAIPPPLPAWAFTPQVTPRPIDYEELAYRRRWGYPPSMPTGVLAEWDPRNRTPLPIGTPATLPWPGYAWTPPTPAFHTGLTLTPSPFSHHRNLPVSGVPNSLRAQRPTNPFYMATSPNLGPRRSRKQPKRGRPKPISRPREWRADYVPPLKLGSRTIQIPRLRNSRSNVQEMYDPTPRIMNPMIRYTRYKPPRVNCDLRNLIPSLVFPYLGGRTPLDVDLAQLICTPAVNFMRLYHPRLPWYIDICATQPSGITIGELFDQMSVILDQAIVGADLYNKDVSLVQRCNIEDAMSYRCAGDAVKLAQGVKKVDFLCDSVCLEGFAKGKKGMWEIKTRDLGC